MAAGIGGFFVGNASLAIVFELGLAGLVGGRPRLALLVVASLVAVLVPVYPLRVLGMSWGTAILAAMISDAVAAGVGSAVGVALAVRSLVTTLLVISVLAGTVALTMAGGRRSRTLIVLIGAAVIAAVLIIDRAIPGLFLTTGNVALYGIMLIPGLSWASQAIVAARAAEN